MYSKIALSPVASETDKCTVAKIFVPGMCDEATTNSSFSKAATTSETVEKLSKTYCSHNETAKPLTLPFFSNFGYCDSTSHKRLPTNPFSFIPSEEAMSHELVITLPYFDFHFTELVPTSPFLSIPRGKIHKLAGISLRQSIDRAVIIFPFKPS